MPCPRRHPRSFARVDTLERFHFHPILDNLFVDGCGASAPINMGLRRLLIIGSSPQGPRIILHVILSFAQDLFGWREQVNPDLLKQ
jgi:hypothetical protein